MAFRGWSDGVADVTAEVTTVKTPSLARRAELRGSRRPSFVSMPRAPRLRASWSATRGGSFPFAHQLGLKISEALRDEGRGKRTGRERGTPESSFTTQPARVP